MNRFLVLLFLLAVLATSCKNSSPEDHEYTNENLGFSMRYPEGFEPIENVNAYIPIGFFEKIKDSTKDYYRENVMLNIEQLPFEVPFNDFVQAGKTQLKLQMKNVKIFEEDTTVINGLKAATYKFYLQKDSVDFLSKYYIIPTKTRVFQFSCTSNSATFDGYEPIFDKIIHSVKIK